MNYNLDELFDIEELRNICESFNELSGITTSIIDLEGKVHVGAGWHSICEQFHLSNKEANKLCIESNKLLHRNLKNKQNYTIRKCQNGLVEVASPIVVNNIHVANLIISQFLTEKPDVEYFIKQAEKYGFDEQKYIDEVNKVPVFSNEKIKTTTKFLVQLTETIGNIGVKNLENIEKNKQLLQVEEKHRAAYQQLQASEQQLRAANQQLYGINQQLSANEQQLKVVIQELAKSEEKLRNIFENSTSVFYSHTPDHVLTYLSPQVENLLGYTQEEALVKWTELVSDNPVNKIGFQHTSKAIKTGKRQPPYNLELVKKSGEKIWVEVRESPVIKNGKNTAIVGSLADITKRKKTEDALKKSDEKFRNIFEHKGTSTAIVGDDSTIKNCNSVFEKKSGYSKAEIIGKMKWSDFVVKEDLERLQAYHSRRMKQKNPPPFQYECGIVNKEGKRLDIIVEISLLGKDRIVSLTDITHQKKVERELLLAKEKAEKNEQKLIRSDRVFNLSLDMFCIAGFDGYFKYLNPAWERTLGWSIEELLSKPWLDFVHPDDVESTKNIKSVIVDGKEIYQFENRYICKDGSVKWLSWNSQPFPKENIMIEAVRDITKTKEIENELVKEKENSEKINQRFDMAMEATSDGLWDRNLITNEIYFSPRWKSILGYEDHELPNEFSVFEKLTKDQDVKHAAKMVDELIEGKRDKYEMELQMQHKKGHWVYILSRANIFNNDENKPYRIVGTHTDISARKKAEKQLIQSEKNLKLKNRELIKAKEKAEESDQLKSAFLANMSHEIRTPMNGILGFTELLKEPDLSGAQRNKFIEIIKKSGDRMLNTVNDIIDISKIDSGQVEISKNEVSISEEIESQKDFFSGEASAKGLKIKLINDLPNQSIIVTDKPKLDSIISNLIKNAIKYTDKGSIEIRCSKKENNLTFSVADTGIGIPKNRIKSIFNRFEQADISDRHAREGSGLGLSITEAYVKILGGTIGVESELGKGSTFYFTLPWIDKQKKPKRIIEKIEIKTDIDNKYNILIAEDDDFSFEHLKIIMDDLANSIFRVDNGKDAIDCVKKNKNIDLILMDAKMPMMDGYEATAEIRKFNTDVIIIAQTAYALEGDEEKAIAAGCNDYISKPINKEKLLKKINKLLYKETD